MHLAEAIHTILQDLESGEAQNYEVGTLDMSSISVETLQLHIETAESVLSRLLPMSLHTKGVMMHGAGGPGGFGGGGGGGGGGGRHVFESIYANMDECPILKHVQEFLHSANVLCDIRFLIKAGDFDTALLIAGQFYDGNELDNKARAKYFKDYKSTGLVVAEKMRQQQNLQHSAKFSLHQTVIVEFQRYFFELTRIKQGINLVEHMRQAIEAKDYELLEHLVFEERALKLSRHMHDLSHIQMLQKSEVVFENFKTICKIITSCLDVYNGETIQKSIDEGIAFGISGPAMQSAQQHLKNLQQFETLVRHIARSCPGGVMTGRRSNTAVLELALSLNMVKHPWAKRSLTMLRLNPTVSRRRAVIAEAMANGTPQLGYRHEISYMVATETMKAKRGFFNTSSRMAAAFRRKFNIDRFPFFRSHGDARILVAETPHHRNSNQQHQQQHNNAIIIVHSNTDLTASLTLLPPSSAFLAVWMYAICIRGIEQGALYFRQIKIKGRPITDSSSTSSLLQFVVLMGKTNVIMRDEIFLQLAKQIRGNPNAAAKDRLWYTVAACLSHFSPSQVLENYLEIFFVEEWEFEQQLLKQLQQQGGYLNTTTSSTATSATPSLPMQCLRLMHEAIFRFGYNVRFYFEPNNRSIDGTLPFNAESIAKINTWIGDFDMKESNPKKTHKH